MELCRLAHWGLPIVPSLSDTISTTAPFEELVNVDFPLDTPHMTDPLNPPPGWESSFDQDPLDRLKSEARHFVLPTTPYEISLVGMFTPLRDVVDPKRTDPSSGAHVINLPQP